MEVPDDGAYKVTHPEAVVKPYFDQLFHVKHGQPNFLIPSMALAWWMTDNGRLNFFTRKEKIMTFMFGLAIVGGLTIAFLTMVGLATILSICMD